MAVLFTSADGDQYRNTATEGNPLTGSPLTLAAWILPATSHFGTPFQNAVFSGSPDDQVLLLYAGPDGDGFLNARRVDGGVTTNATAGGLGQPPTTFQHVGMTFASATSCFAWTNGTAGTEDTTSNAPGSFDYIRIGGSPGFNGDICEVAAWSRALTSDEMSGLANGYSPLFFSDNLELYYPMREHVDPQPDVIAGFNLPVVAGSPVTSTNAHPDIVYPLYRGAMRGVLQGVMRGI